VVARFIAAAVASLVVIALSGVTMYLFARPARTTPAWTVTKATSAHHTMVIDVEAMDLDRSREIAEEIVAPLRTRQYDEVLIYVHPFGRRDAAAAVHRLQWTPRGGFVESRY
jgi:hypothetical protein